jgi:tetratricopeptide (TPR) repeat protein
MAVLSQQEIIAQRIGDYLQYGKIELEKENYTEAIKYFNNSIKHRSASYEGYFLRGIAKYSLDDFIGAEKDFTQASVYDPFNPEIYHYRAIARSEQYNFGGAFEDYETAIEIDPKNAYYYLNRARTYLYIHEYESAITDCNKAIELKFTKENVFLMRGMAKAGIELYDEALKDLDIAIRKKPENTYGYVQRGAVWMGIKEPDSALVDFNKALAINNDDSYALFNRAQAFMELDDTTNAFQDLDRVIELSPYNSYAYYNRAILKTGTNDTQGAIEDLTKVLAMNPENIVVYLYRGRMKASAGDLQGAINDYDNAIEIYPDFADAYFERSQAKKALQDYFGAEEDYNMAYAINKFNFNDNDSLRLEEEMYLKRIIAFSGEFYDKGTDNIRIQDKIVQIELKPIFTTVVYSKNMETIRMFDTFEKPAYHAEIISLSSNQDRMAGNIANTQLDTLEQKIRSNPSDPVNYYNRAEIYANMQNYNKALQDYDIAIMLDPDYILAYFNRANIRFKLTDLISEEYKTQYQLNATFIQPAAPQSTFDTTFLEHSYEEILNDYNKVIDLDTDFFYAYFNRGYVKCIMGDYWGSVSDYEKALDYEPKFSEAFYNKGLILIYLNLKTVGCESMSKAGELGIQESYHVMKRYCN